MNHLSNFEELKMSIQACRICADDLELGPRPIVSIHPKSQILIIGQAPGAIVHRTGIPWDDKSGENLRKWMGINNDTFYNPQKIGIVPMGFCYPGKGKSGDLPPRKECAPQWHSQIFSHLDNVSLTLLIGKYAQNYYLGNHSSKKLTDNVKNYKSFLPKYFVLPHPSPRNNIWQKKNPWFGQEVLPDLKDLVKRIL